MIFGENKKIPNCSGINFIGYDDECNEYFIYADRKGLKHSSFLNQLAKELELLDYVRYGIEEYQRYIKENGI